MRQAIFSALKNRFAVLLVLIVFVTSSIFVLQKLTIDAVPDITNIQVMINTKTGPLSPEQIEKLVTFPIENEVNGITGVDEVRSLSKFGLSQVVVVFNDKTDIYWARNQIAERLRSVSLPENLSPEMAPITTGLGEVLMYTLSVRSLSDMANLTEREQLIKLRMIQDLVIRPELRRIQGVADVDTNGGYRREVHINIFPEKLNKLGITIQELKTLLMGVGETQGGGYFEENGKQIIIGVRQELNNLKALSELPIKQVFGGRVVKIKDVAEVRIESGLRVGAATTAGQETVLGTVLMRSGANSREVARESAERLLALKLPEGVQAKIHYSRAYLVNATINTVIKNLIEGAVLVILVLLLLLGDWRSSIIVAATIPLAMLGAFIGMNYFGISANLMSLGAIDFGLIVDASVVLIENYVRNAGQDKNKNRLSFFYESTVEVAKPILFGVIIIMLVYVPILFLGGTEGKMFKPMAVTVLLALGSSLLLALFVVPALAYFILKIDHVHKTPKVFILLESLYSKTLKWIMDRPKVIISGVALISVSAIFILIFKVGSDFIPQLNEGDLVIGLVRPSSMGITESIAQQKKSEEFILSFPEVESVFSRMGTPDSATDPMSVNFADTFVILKKDKNKWPVNKKTGRIRTKSELFDEMKTGLEKITEQEVSATQPIEMRFNEILEGSRADVTLRIYGPDLEKLAELIDQSKSALEGMEGLSDSQYDSLTALTKSPTLEIIPKMDALPKLGVTYSSLREVFQLTVGGERLGSLSDSQYLMPIVMHLDESLRDRRNSVKQIPVEVAGMGVVPLEKIADFKDSQRVTTVARSWGQRYSALSLFVKGRDIQSFVSEAQSRVEKQVVLPDGYKFYWGGQFKNMQEARSRLMILVPLTLLLILFLLYKNFSSWSESLIVFSAVPLAMIGGVFSLWMRGMNMTVPASIGFIALAGISVLNGIVMVTFTSELIKKGMSPETAAYEGARLRLRPVLMTALVAALGFIPMALNTAIGSEVQQPLATVVIGGLVSSTLLTLLVVPLACARLLKGAKHAEV